MCPGSCSNWLKRLKNTSVCQPPLSVRDHKEAKKYAIQNKNRKQKADRSHPHLESICRHMLRHSIVSTAGPLSITHSVPVTTFSVGTWRRPHQRRGRDGGSGGQVEGRVLAKGARFIRPFGSGFIKTPGEEHSRILLTKHSS